MTKLFEVHQKITMLANEYVILKDEDLEQKVCGYAKQKRLALREQFTIFRDETQTQVLVASKARSIMDLSPTFDVFDDNQKPLAVLKKEFKKSLLVSSWTIYDKQMKATVFTISEKSPAIAIARRAWEFIPFISEIMPFPLKFHFSVKSGDKIVGEYTKITTIRDHYALHLDEGAIDVLDERAWMVMAVLLDAMQSR
ncbi:hypothetical protein H0X09_00620 [Candidatus Saccharibacteria bacterium]|nr:hypothetical protein [Candidatus Saccharibacteria bacterium]